MIREGVGRPACTRPHFTPEHGEAVLAVRKWWPGELLPSQTELFLLWFPPTAAPFRLFMAELSHSLLGGFCCGSQRFTARKPNGGRFHFHICLFGFHSLFSPSSRSLAAGQAELPESDR